MKETIDIRHKVLENLPFPYSLIEYDEEIDDYIVIDCNKKFQLLFPDRNVFNTSIDDLFINEKTILRDLFKDNDSEDRSVYVYINNHNKCFEFTAQNAGDRLISFTGADCTDLKNIENAWHRTEALYKSVFNNSNQAIIIVDKNKKLLAYNELAEKIAGYFFGSVLAVNQPISDILPDQELSEFNVNFFKALNGKSLKHEKMFENRENESKEWFEIFYQSIKNDNDKTTGVCMVMHTVTERKRYELEMKDLITALKLANRITDENFKHIQSLNDELAKSETELIKLNAKKDKFFSIIAHDLKNPLQGFLGLTKDLAENFNTFNLDELNDYFVTLYDTAKQLYKLLENLLLWSRIQRGSVEQKYEILSLKDLINLNIDLSKINAKRKNINVLNNVDKDISVYADLNMLNTIIRNLLSNAIKFTPEGGRIEFKAAYIPGDKKVIFKIIDNGVGIDEDTKSKLFKIDKQMTTKGTNNESGTGLGLILCQDLVEKNNGTISVQSKPGEGTAFIISLVSAV